MYLNEFYFFYSNDIETIFIKGIDSDEPLPWLSLKLHNNNGRSLKASKKMNCLVVLLADKRHLTIILLDRKNIVNILQKHDIVIDEDSEIEDFKIFGDQENKIATLSNNGLLNVFHVRCTAKGKKEMDVKPVGKLEIQLNLDLEEYAFSLSICPKSRFFAIHTLTKEHKGARVIIVEYITKTEEPELVIKTWNDFEEEKLVFFKACDFYGYFSDELIFCGLTGSKPCRIITFGYDTFKNKLRILESLRVKYDAICKPFKVTRMAGMLWTSDYNCNLVKIKYKLRNY